MARNAEEGYEPDSDEIEAVILALDAVYNECKIRAGMEKYENDGIDYLGEARVLKTYIDKFRLEQFSANSQKFVQLRSNYSEIVASEKARLMRLKDLVDNLSMMVDFATVLDDAAKIAAGLAQSM